MSDAAKDVQASPPGSPLRRSLPGRFWFNIPLWKRIVPALIAGIAVGLIWGPQAIQVRWLGDIFVRLAHMLVAPLVFLTVASGVIGMGDPKGLGRLGARSLSLFAGTAMIAAALGVGLGLLLHPGVGVSLKGVVPEIIRPGRTLGEQLLGIIPLNPLQALAEGDTLAIIFFAILFSAGVLTLGARARPLTAVIDLSSEVMIKLIGFVMEVAPFGVFGLMAATVGAHGVGMIVNVAVFAVAMAAGCVLQIVVVQAGLVFGLTGLSPFSFLRKSLDAMIVAFSTSSSSAGLPVTMLVAERELGLPRAIISTVLPVGAGVARDGTALFVALLSVFALQTLGLPLNPTRIALVILLSTLLAVGAPPAPSAALFMMAAVLSVVGINGTQSALIVGLVLPFDRLLDMIRTTTNVVGNLTNATIMGRWMRDVES
jgi:Na+/H+-dicarboxylate symporter